MNTYLQHYINTQQCAFSKVIAIYSADAKLTAVSLQQLALSLLSF